MQTYLPPSARIPASEAAPGFPYHPGDARRPEPATPTAAAVREAARELATLVLLAREVVALLGQARDLLAAVQSMTTTPAGEQQAA
jgi:hypothetical protein